jgi:hypothetical protein
MKYILEGSYLFGLMARDADLEKPPMITITVESFQDYMRLEKFMKMNWDLTLADPDASRNFFNGHVIEVNGVRLRFARRDK